MLAIPVSDWIYNYIVNISNTVRQFTIHWPELRYNLFSNSFMLTEQTFHATNYLVILAVDQNYEKIIMDSSTQDNLSTL